MMLSAQRIEFYLDAYWSEGGSPGRHLEINRLKTRV
jgi:hypothetical protein